MGTNLPDTTRPATFASLCDYVRESLEVTPEDSRVIVLSVLRGITRLAHDHPYLKLKAFGKFEYRLQKSRRNVSPVAGGEVILPPRVILKFSASPTLHEVVV